MTYIPITCYTQNPGCSSVSQNTLLVNAWESQNVDGFLEIIGPSFHMLSKHMCTSFSSVTSVTSVIYTYLNQSPDWFHEPMTIENYSMIERHIPVSSSGNNMTIGTESLSTNVKLGRLMLHHAILGHKCVKPAAMHT